MIFTSFFSFYFKFLKIINVRVNFKEKSMEKTRKSSYKFDLSLHHKRERKTGCNSMSKNSINFLGEIPQQNYSTLQINVY